MSSEKPAKTEEDLKFDEERKYTSALALKLER
jgi:hypothetical protein